MLARSTCFQSTRVAYTVLLKPRTTLYLKSTIDMINTIYLFGFLGAGIWGAIHRSWQVTRRTGIPRRIDNWLRAFIHVVVTGGTQKGSLTGTSNGLARESASKVIAVHESGKRNSYTIIIIPLGAAAVFTNQTIYHALLHWRHFGHLPWRLCINVAKTEKNIKISWLLRDRKLTARSSRNAEFLRESVRPSSELRGNPDLASKIRRTTIQGDAVVTAVTFNGRFRPAMTPNMARIRCTRAFDRLQRQWVQSKKQNENRETYKYDRKMITVSNEIPTPKHG